jgi:hypothetical protein
MKGCCCGGGGGRGGTPSHREAFCSGFELRKGNEGGQGARKSREERGEEEKRTLMQLKLPTRRPPRLELIKHILRRRTRVYQRLERALKLFRRRSGGSLSRSIRTSIARSIWRVGRGGRVAGGDIGGRERDEGRGKLALFGEEGVSLREDGCGDGREGDGGGNGGVGSFGLVRVESCSRVDGLSVLVLRKEMEKEGKRTCDNLDQRSLSIPNLVLHRSGNASLRLLDRRLERWSVLRLNEVEESASDCSSVVRQFKEREESKIRKTHPSPPARTQA